MPVFTNIYASIERIVRIPKQIPSIPNSLDVKLTAIFTLKANFSLVAPFITPSLTNKSIL